MEHFHAPVHKHEHFRLNFHRQVSGLAGVRIGNHHQMPGVVRIQVQHHASILAPAKDVVLAIVVVGDLGAEHAPFGPLSLKVFHPPWSPEPFHLLLPLLDVGAL
jgi:hypothetical protein